MVVVAVAGGTGNVGRAIVDAIVATGKHEVKILSRKENPALEAEIGVPILAVDYSDVEAAAKLLEDHNVHTVVSGISTHATEVGAPQEAELVRAADLSRTTKRIISSQWGVPIDEIRHAAIPSTAPKVAARDALQECKDLEHTVFMNGYFMDYWGIPGVESYMARSALTFWIDMANDAAAIPGSGDTPAVFTHTRDVARFVAASLDLPKWEPETYIFGDRLTWNEFLRLAEDAKGTKFKVAYDSLENLKAGKVTELPGQVPMHQFIPKEYLDSLAAVFGTFFVEGDLDLKPPNNFLNEVFPDIKPMTVKEMLDKAWRK